MLSGLGRERRGRRGKRGAVLRGPELAGGPVQPLPGGTDPQSLLALPGENPVYRWTPQ